MKAEIITFLMAMVPVVELRGAIPYGVIAGLSVQRAMIIAILGNIVPVPFILMFARRVFEWLKPKNATLRRWVNWLEDKGRSKEETIMRAKFWGLMILVAIPLPGTGAWTGCLAATMLDMDPKKAAPPVALGVVIAGIIVSVLTYGVDMVI